MNELHSLGNDLGDPRTPSLLSNVTINHEELDLLSFPTTDRGALCIVLLTGVAFQDLHIPTAACTDAADRLAASLSQTTVPCRQMSFLRGPLRHTF